MKTFESRGSRPRHHLIHRLVLGVLVMALVPSVQAENALQRGMPSNETTDTSVKAQTKALSPAYARWQSSLDSFAKADQAQHPASDGLLFVGSSTIRRWSRLSQAFSHYPVLLNRGFGGSTMDDCNALVRELVIQYKPRQVVVYAGENDLAEGHSPAEVLNSFSQFVQSVQAELPGSPITYISIKPSPLRQTLMPQIQETNALIARYAQTMANVHYIDIFTPMLTQEGLARAELFLDDRLHLNEAGYQLWQSLIATHLSAPPMKQQTPARTGTASVPASRLTPHAAR